jgi:hypothetical protein
MSLLKLCAVIAIWTPLIAAAQQDEVQSKLDVAKAAYKSSIGIQKKAVEEWFEKEDETARKAKIDGLARVKKIQAEADQFYENGALPERAPAGLKQARRRASDDLVRAYNEAISSYLSEKADSRAESIRDEMVKFVLPTVTGRWKLQYDVKVRADVEIKANGSAVHVDTVPRREAGTVDFNGKDFIIRYRTFIEVWAVRPDGESINVKHFIPIATYPDGKPNNTASAVRSRISSPK